jgi:hypothetical protein
MPVRDTSLMAYEQIRKQLRLMQWRVFEVLALTGPAHDLRILEVLNQQEKQSPRETRRIWHINEVTNRRGELVELGLVKDLGKHHGSWYGRKKTYHIWAVQGDNRQPAGWVRLPDEPHKIEKTKCSACLLRRQFNILRIRRMAEIPVLTALAISDAGRTLALCRESKRQEPKRQMSLW